MARSQFATVKKISRRNSARTLKCWVPKGMIKTIRGGAIKHGDQLTVRYIPLPISRTNEKLPAVHVIFPNTATPPPPQVDFVIPAAARDVQVKSISHDGRLLRVYLQRPWNVSGDGETLAVLIERNPSRCSQCQQTGTGPRGLQCQHSSDLSSLRLFHGLNCCCGELRWHPRSGTA